MEKGRVKGCRSQGIRESPAVGGFHNTSLSYALYIQTTGKGNQSYFKNVSQIPLLISIPIPSMQSKPLFCLHYKTSLVSLLLLLLHFKSILHTKARVNFQKSKLNHVTLQLKTLRRPPTALRMKPIGDKEPLEGFQQGGDTIKFENLESILESHSKSWVEGREKRSREYSEEAVAW